jgi:FMN phosphatase YigB (HAD superfamily)
MAKIGTVKAIVFDTGGILYHRPRQDRHLAAFLEQHELRLRQRSVVERALRAATFDVHTGRITRDAFYDAILRVHGLSDDGLFPAGREALLRDAADIELFPGVVETLRFLKEAGYRLGAIADSAHTSDEKIAWLEAHKVPPGMWSAFVVSSQVGATKSGPLIFQRALGLLKTAATETAFVGHSPVELGRAGEVGMLTVAFLPDDPGVRTDCMISSFYGVQRLFTGK